MGGNYRGVVVELHDRGGVSSFFVPLIKSCKLESQVIQIHSKLVLSSLFEISAISSAFLYSLVRFSSFRKSAYLRLVFDNLPRPSISLANTVIRAYSRSDAFIQGFHLYRGMRRTGLSADSVTLSYVVKCLLRISSVVGGLQIHAVALRDGFDSDNMLLYSLMDLYSRFERSSEACKVFEEMDKKDIVAWNVLMSCYLHDNKSMKVLALFDRMQNQEFGYLPDEVTCLFVLRACANLGALEFGKKVQRFITKHGYDDLTKLGNSLISMFSRCGSLKKAYRAFCGIQNKDVISWTALISGFARNGYARETFNAFEQMIKFGLLPVEQTFTGVLCACSHCGLVDEGWMYFNMMRQVFGLIPNVIHYGCMIDLLSRSGQLDEAYKLIMSMNVEPDATMWRTLLAGCRVHRNCTIAEYVIEQLVKRKSEEAGDYVLLMSIYFAVGKKQKVTELRKFLQHNRMFTTAGCSYIMVQHEVYKFMADNISLPRMDETHRMVTDVNKQLKIIMCTPTTSELENEFWIFSS